MKRIMKTCLLSFLFIILSSITFASFAASPMGYWKTIDDVTGKAKSILKIEGSPSDLTGTVVKLYPGAMTVCSNCKGSLKGKPILGMTVMHGLKQDSSDANKWSGGTIFDPKNGQSYHCTITVSADGNRLEVRGYIGISLFGRSQTWIRVPGV